MSSSPLYLAIVVVWLIVLVPMLLRKDAVDPIHEDGRDDEEEVPDAAGALEEDEEGPGPTEARTLARSGGLDDSTGRGEGFGPSAPRPARYTTRASEPRARVIARRRRRTSALTLLNVATIVAVAFGLGPWWVLAPPVLLLTGHLALLREAAKADAERSRARFDARRRAASRARRAREADEREAERDAERKAEVVALKERRSQVYDQYADARLRAAGD